MSPFANIMTLYIENPKDDNQKLIELMKEFSKVAGYKINIQKSVAFLYTINELSERSTEETTPLKIASKWIKHLGINQPKEVKDLYSENYKTLMKEIEDNTNGKVCHVHGLEELILLKWPYYSRQSINSMWSLSIYQEHFFHRTWTDNTKIIWKHKYAK